jgi:hypothetical protein
MTQTYHTFSRTQVFFRVFGKKFPCQPRKKTCQEKKKILFCNGLIAKQMICRPGLALIATLLRRIFAKLAKKPLCALQTNGCKPLAFRIFGKWAKWRICLS